MTCGGQEDRRIKRLERPSLRTLARVYARVWLAPWRWRRRLRHGSFPALLQEIEAAQVDSPPLDLPLALIARIVHRRSVYSIRWRRRRCQLSSLLFADLLPRAGYAVTLHLGFRGDEDAKNGRNGLLAHCWITSPDSETVNGFMRSEAMTEFFHHDLRPSRRAAGARPATVDQPPGTHPPPVREKGGDVAGAAAVASDSASAPPGRRCLDLVNGEQIPIRDPEFAPRVRVMLAWIYSRKRPYRWKLVLSWLLVALLSGASALPVFLARRIVQDFQGTAQRLWMNLAALVIVIATIGGLRLLGTALAASVNLRLRRDIEDEYVRRLAAAPLAYYESNSSASLALTAFNQIPLLAGLGDIVLRNFLQTGLTALMVLAFLFYTSYLAGLCAVLVLPFFLLAPHVLSRSVERSVRDSFLRIAEMHTTLVESLISVKTIRTLGISERRVAEIGRLAADALKQERLTLLLSGVSQFMMDIVFAIGIAALLFLLNRRAVFHASALPLSAAALTGFLLLAKEARMLANGMMELRRIVSACTHLVDFLQHTEPLGQTSALEGPREVDRLALEDIRFTYDGVRDVLRGVNMVFFRNQITGIVGLSGGGKSTLADLLLRLREPTGGRILVNDQNLSDLAEPWLRRTFSFVDQEPFLLNTSIRENLLLGAPHLGEPELLDLLESASARALVEALPQGLDSRVGEAGTLLSVGEKQRIALARALAVQPDVLVLDEITSALDAENERVILQTLQRLKTGRLIILISHRERVNDICDRIYRIKAGQAELVLPARVGEAR